MIIIINNNNTNNNIIIITFGADDAGPPKAELVFYFCRRRCRRYREAEVDFFVSQVFLALFCSQCPFVALLAPLRPKFENQVAAGERERERGNNY